MSQTKNSILGRQSTVRNAYIIMIVLSVIIILIGLILSSLVPDKFSTIVAVVVGGAFSFVASMVIQLFSSKEQYEMIRSVTINAEGVQSLPDSFYRLKWFAHATKLANEDGQQDTHWRISPLVKSGTSGQRFSSYTLDTNNLVGDKISYTLTCIGLQGCVIGVISKENETTSSLILDTAVPDAGVFFGAAYLTDWDSERDLTLMIVGTSEISELEDLPESIKNAFKRWYGKMDWRVEDAYKTFPFNNKE